MVRDAGWMSIPDSGLHTERHLSDDGRHDVEETQTR